MSNKTNKDKEMAEKDYNAVREAIKKIIPQEDYDDGSAGPVLVRLGWHASGTFDIASHTGGSNGSTMRFALEKNDDANNGLEHARAFLEPIKKQFPWISYSDLWTLAAVVAVEELDGPVVPWRPGRIDYEDDKNVPPNGRLPDAAQGEQHVRDVFYRMGFNDQEIVALVGAHNLGRCHRDRSGFDGKWVPRPTVFNNTFFKMLLSEEDYEIQKLDEDHEQYWNEDMEIMMLPADMALVRDAKFKKWVEIYAKDLERFHSDFAKAFGKLLELGVRRGADGKAQVNLVNVGTGCPFNAKL